MVTRKSRLSKMGLPSTGAEQSETGVSLAQSQPEQEGKRNQDQIGNDLAGKLLERIREENSRVDNAGQREPAIVTVIIPAWLRDDQDLIWLAEAVESVINQTAPYRCIIVENGSEFLTELTGNIAILHSEKGLSKARNAGIKASETEFFFPLDANDWLPEQALEIALSKRPAKGFLYGSTMLFNQTRGMGDQHFYEAKPYDFEEIKKMVYFPNGALQRKADWELAGGYRESLPFLEDWDYWLTCGEKGICGTAIPETLYWYRRHAGIVTTNNKTAEWEKVKMLIQSYHKEIYRGVYPAMCCGKKAQPAPNYSIPGAASLTPGADGMLLIEYQGGNLGKMTWYGPITGARYVAGGSQRQIYIDVRDALTGSRSQPGLLEMIDHGAPVFTRVA